MFVDQGWSVFVSTSFWIFLPFKGVFQQKCHLLNLSERQFSVTYPQNICLKAQILPRNFYSVRKDKHFWITVPFTHQSNSEYVFLLTSLRFSEVHISFPKFGDCFQRVKKGHLKISVQRKYVPSVKFSNESMVISCPRSFDKTRSGSQNYVLNWWVFPFVTRLKFYV